MAEWATMKAEKVLNRFSSSIGVYMLLIIVGGLIARANILGIYPFAIAYIAVLSLDSKKKIVPGLIGITLGLSSVQNISLLAEVLPAALLCGIAISKLKDHKYELYLLPVFTGALTALVGVISIALTVGMKADALIFLLAQCLLAAGFSVIFNYAFARKDSILKGNFSGEQGMAWMLIIAVTLNGLQGLHLGQINFQIVLLGFAILYIADKYGAGSAAGAGAILGFLLRWSFGVENLIDAGTYGMLGFACGGFRHFGKLGLAAAYTAATLMITFFVNEGFLTSLLYSAMLGLLAYLLLPAKKKEKVSLKNRVMPEIETTISKVKTLADIFDQLAFGFQAAGLESKLKPEVPELMNILVERVCKNCPTNNYCWEREFFRTYNFMFDLFAQLETQRGMAEIDEKSFPAEWKKNCGNIKEVVLAARFIIEQQKDREIWQKRLALNREALADQYRSVSQVISHLARELHSRHNAEDGKPLVWSRHHRLVLDMGVGTFIKTGNGISGDNFNSVPLSHSKNALIVCDGMGVGEEAARMSSAALTILEQLLSTGFDPEGAVKALNAILVLRSPEESFVTVDMAVLDIEEDSARLIKIGAAPTYIISKDKVESIKTSSLPAGILNDIDIPVIDISFRDQTLVIVTDGVLDVVNKEGDWLKAYLDKSHFSSAQELADSIIKESTRLSGGRLEDDGVVLVVRRKDRK